MRLLLVFLVGTLLASGSCRPVEGDFILARDFELDVSAFSVLQPETHLGFAPMPGTRRTFTGQEIAAVARGHNIAADAFPSICFERAVRPLLVEQVLQAMQTGLGLPGANIEIVDFLREAVPKGELEFSRSGLGIPSRHEPDTPIVWRGRLKYAQQSTMAVWAKVHIWVKCTTVVAAREIARGVVVSTEDVVLENRDLFPFAPHLDSLENVVGRTIRRATSAGVLITADILADPPIISRGDTVEVSASSGAATVSFSATALTSGRGGDSIMLLNPQSHRVVKATVAGKGKATIKL